MFEPRQIFRCVVANEVIVEPPGLFKLEEDSVGRGEFVGREVEDEAGVDVVQGVGIGGFVHHCHVYFLGCWCCWLRWLLVRRVAIF